MKRIILSFIGLTAALSILWVGVLHAANVRSGESPTVMSNETVDGTLYAAGNSVSVDGTVKGDLICAGQQVTVTGTVEGDVLCAAQNLSIRGHVLGDVRSAAQTSDMTGKVDGSISMLGQTMTFGDGSVVGRDATLIGQDIRLSGHFTRDVEVMGQALSSAAIIGRDLDVTAEKVTVNKSDIAGNFVYTSNNNASVSPDARIGGQTDHKYPKKEERPTVAPSAMAASMMYWFISSLLIALVLLLVAPKLLDSTAEKVKTAPLATLGIGLLALILTPVVIVMLIITVVGLPLAIVLLFGWIVSLILAGIFTAQALGNFIITKMQWNVGWQRPAALLLGMLVLFLLGLVPMLGGFVIFASLLWGLGALWYVMATGLRERATQPTKKEAKK